MELATGEAKNGHMGTDARAGAGCDLADHLRDLFVGRDAAVIQTAH